MVSWLSWAPSACSRPARCCSRNAHMCWRPTSGLGPHFARMSLFTKTFPKKVVWSPLWWMGTERKGLWLLRQQTGAASQLGTLSLCPATAVGQGGACPVCFPCCLLLGEVWMQWLGVAGLCVEVSSVSALHFNISTVLFLHYFP